VPLDFAQEVLRPAWRSSAVTSASRCRLPFIREAAETGYESTSLHGLVVGADSSRAH